MSAADALQEALVRLSFSAAVARTLVVNEGLMLDECSMLEDKDVDYLCRMLCKPNSVTGTEARQVPDPGMRVSFMARLHLKGMCFFLR
jgi:hypothetical protein